MNKIGQRLFAVVICLCMLACCLPAVQAQTDWIDISSVEAFLTFAEDCRLDSFSRDKSFRLTADLDLTATEFDGIPIFCGTFDGNGHKITGICIDGAGSAKGLFRYVQPGATVQNLTAEGVVSPAGSKTQVGGIVGYNGGIIENCSFLGQVSGAENVGMIAGVNVTGGIIRGCTSSGSVSGKHFVGGIVGSNNGLVEDAHNYADVNITPQQNDTNISDITMDSLNNSESLVTATDIGGIAGFSDGHILRCSNRGSVGYQHMGYNVGGIVGLQTGYVADCVNYGSVCGRKEVGGIAGQQEPEVRLHYSTDTLQILKEQVAELSELIKQASNNVNSNSAQIKNLIDQLQKQVNNIEKAISQIEKIAEDPQLEDLRTILQALETIQSSLEGVEKCLDKLWTAIDKTATDLTTDMNAISLQLAVIENTLNNADEGIGGAVFDISDADTPQDLGSKVEDSINYGAVLADLNVGGIVGSVAFENDLDPEEDITVEGDRTLNAAGTVRSVILRCENFGAVKAKTMAAGGIAGRLSIGLIRECVNTGLLYNPTADYVGGIAGLSDGYIRSCLVKCGLSGDMYVGGIAGSGCIATACQSMVSLSGTERLGAIFGLWSEPRTEMDEPVKENLYLRADCDVGAIDGISYDGVAQGLELTDFLQLQPAGSIFRSVTITFVADGAVVLEVKLPTGSGFADIPQVPVKDGATGRWADLETLNLECMLFDVTVVAEYIQHETVLQSDRIAENGKPILLLQGDFALGASVKLTALENIPALMDGQKLVQGWEVMTEHCLTQRAGRVLIPVNVDAEHLSVMVRNKEGQWSQRSHRIDGSYIVFSLSDGDDAVVLVQVPANGMTAVTAILLAGTGLLVMAVIVVTCVVLKRQKARSVPKTEEAQA